MPSNTYSKQMTFHNIFCSQGLRVKLCCRKKKQTGGRLNTYIYKHISIYIHIYKMSLWSAKRSAPHDSFYLVTFLYPV